MMEEAFHYSDVTMSVMASQITGASIVCSTVCSGADQRKHQSFASLAFVRRIHRWPVVSSQKSSDAENTYLQGLFVQNFIWLVVKLYCVLSV